MDKISFTTNIPVELSLAFLEGKPVEGRFGDQYLFSTVDGRVFYVSTTVGQILEKQLLNLKIEKGEPIEIGKFEQDLGRGRRGIQWLVKRVMPEADGVAPAPVTPVKDTRLSFCGVNERPEPTEVNGNGSKPAIATGFAQHLLEQTTTLTDIFAAAVRYAKEMHGDAVKPDDIRSILLSAYINASKGGQRAA